MFFHNDGLVFFLSLFIYLSIAFYTAHYARMHGKNPLLWFIIAILLGFLAPLILLFLTRGVNGVDRTGRMDRDGYPTMTVSSPDPSVEREAVLPEHVLLPEEEKLWYYLDQNHQQIGPVSVVALRELWNRGLLELNQYVWSEGMKDWEKVEQLPNLQKILNRSV